MPLGRLAPFPFRLGGTATNGLTAEQHARIAADYVALKRCAPLAVWTYTQASGAITLHGYLGQNGEGSAFAWDYEVEGTGVTLWTFTGKNFVDPLDGSAPIAARGAKVSVHGGTAATRCFEVYANAIRIRTFDAAGSAADAKVTVKVF